MTYNITQTIKDARSHIGQYTYSMTERWAPTKRDCSTFVLQSLRGNIESLPSDWYTVTEEQWLVTHGFNKLPLATPQEPGDIYIIWKTQNIAGGDAHTFIATEGKNCIDCSNSQKGVKERNVNTIVPSGWNGAIFRYQGKAITPTPAPVVSTPVLNKLSKPQTKKILYAGSEGLWVRNEPKENSPTVAVYKKGQTVTVDSWIETKEARWDSYIAVSGTRRYIKEAPVGKSNVYLGVV